MFLQGSLLPCKFSSLFQGCKVLFGTGSSSGAKTRSLTARSVSSMVIFITKILKKWSPSFCVVEADWDAEICQWDSGSGLSHEGMHLIFCILGPEYPGLETTTVPHKPEVEVPRGLDFL